LERRNGQGFLGFHSELALGFKMSNSVALKRDIVAGGFKERNNTNCLSKKIKLLNLIAILNDYLFQILDFDTF